MITIYSMTMLIWGSRYQWTLASTLLYVGFAGWAIGGVGAVIDSLIPINFRLHNTTWVVAHFHTYLILGVVIWGLAFLAHLLERASGRTSSRAARTWTITLVLVGGYGLTGTWFVEGHPRRPPPLRHPTAGNQQLQPCWRRVWTRACDWVPALLHPTHPSCSGSIAAAPGKNVRAEERQPGMRLESGGAVPATAVHPFGPPWRGRRDVPLATPSQLGFGVAACTIGLAAFFPRIVEASEVSNRYHHLDHSGQFFFGAMLGLVLGSLPAISRRLGDHSSLGLAAVLVAPMLMMMVMVPRIFEPLERHPLEHALYHLAMVAFGLITGLGLTRLGLVTGRLMFVLSIGMPVMFAAAMK